MVTARRFLLNLTVLSAGDLVAKLLIFLAVVHMGRVLGTGLFGDIAFVTALTLYFSLIATQGFDLFAIQEAARDVSLVRKRAAIILGIRLLTSAVALTVLALFAWQLDKPEHVKTLLLLYGVSFVPAALSLQWVFQATEQMKLVALANVLSQAVFSGLVLLFLRGPSGLLWIPVFQLAGEFSSALLFLFFYTRQLGPLRFSFGVTDWLRMLRQTIPIGLSSALSLLMLNFDMVLLGFLRPASEVGEYSAAYKVIALFASLVLVYNRNLLPAVARCRGKPDTLQRIASKTQKYVLLLSVPLAVGGTMLAGPLMQLIFGPQFTDGATALAILIWVVPITSIRVLYRATLLSHGLQTQNLWAAVAAVAVNIAMNLALIPSFGYPGSAVASLTAEALLLILSWQVVLRKVASVPFLPHVWKPLLICIPMMLFLRQSEALNVMLRIPAGFLIYVLSGLALKVIDLNEIRSLLPGMVRVRGNL
jgi:O-antigen/teichoic acid export membrane protein